MRSLTLVALTVLSLVALASSPAPAAGPRRDARQDTGASRSDARRGGPMPDSVLAWIGSRREVSLAAFRLAWRQVAPPARPDSLTPEAARGFLGLLTGKEALAEQALLAPPAWTAEDSARVDGLRDRLTLRVVLDSVLAATHARLRAAGDSTADAQAIGVAAREDVVARLAPRWDDEALARVLEAFRALPRPTADSGVMAQVRMLSRLPHLAPADSGRVLARTARGDYRAADLLAWWARLDPLGRPRIEDATQLRDLAANGLFERALREEAALHAVAQRPEVTQGLERLREFIAVEHLVGREVYARIAMDSLTLRRHYERHRDDYALPLRLRVLRLVLDDRASATEMALRVRVEADAESLVARAARRGVRYDEDLSAARDSALFARGLRAGPGAVLGPDSVAAGWEVVRVRSVLPARVRTFEESRTFVENDWYGREGERLMNELLDRCRKAVPIRLNERALAGLTSP